MIKYSIGASSLKDATSTPEAYFRDAYGTCEEIKVGELGRSCKWRVTSRISTIYDLIETHRYEPAGAETSASSIELVCPHFHVGVNLYGTITSISDSNNVTSGIPLIDVAHGQQRIITQYIANTTLEDPKQVTDDIVQQELARYVENAVDTIFAIANDQNFEDGMESTFSRELLCMVVKYGNLAMGEILYLIRYTKVNNEVAGEALRWLARVEDPSTYASRLWLLEKSLSSASPLIRDSAGLGLATMGDTHAIPYLKDAIEKETISELREDLIKVLEELEASEDVPPIEKDPKI